MKGLFNALKGIGGEYEIQRILGAFGTMIYSVTVPAFVATGVIDGVSVTSSVSPFPVGSRAASAPRPAPSP